MKTSEIIKLLNNKIQSNNKDMKARAVMDKVLKGMADNMACGSKLEVHIDRYDFEDKYHKNYQADLEASNQLLQDLEKDGFQVKHYTEDKKDQDFSYTVYLD